MGLADRSEELDGIIERDEVFDVVVIGSGYGAGVCAARLAEAGAKVCVLERGREFTAGQFPSKLSCSQRTRKSRTSLIVARVIFKRRATSSRSRGAVPEPML